MKKNNNVNAFLALVRAGLWEQDVMLSEFNNIDYREIYRLSEEQSVTGLVAAGLEHVIDVNIPQEITLVFVGNALQLEKRNLEMNVFVSSLIEKMRKADIYTLLVKGQGIAQCYERPLWRACGDVDLFLSQNNYLKALSFLKIIASSLSDEESYKQHQGMTIGSWKVELHGTMRADITNKMDSGIDEVQNCVFYYGEVRSWLNGNTQIFLPEQNCDLIFVFTHILHHLYEGGVGLRQICDLCRLLWTYNNTIKISLLETRLRKMGIMTEWKSFAAFLSDYLGVPADIIPLYSTNKKWSRKSKHILSFVLETGNFGHNRDYSYYGKYPLVWQKLISLWRKTKDMRKLFYISPTNTCRYFLRFFANGVKAVF